MQFSKSKLFFFQGCLVILLKNKKQDKVVFTCFPVVFGKIWSVLIYHHFPSPSVFHYQFRIQFINQIDKIDPTLTVSLTGTLGESENLPITL